MSDEYVTPTKKNHEDEYVAPPKKTGSTKQGTETKGEYVAPPKKQTQQQTVKTSSSGQGYFDTPKMPWRFYLTGYLILSLLGLFFMSDNLIIKGLYLVYFLISNYTYSWFADYQRFKGGVAGWFFTPYGSVKTGFAYSSMMNYSTGSVRRTWTGDYKIKTHTGITDHMISFVLMTLVIELIKYVVAIPVAFISLFIHKRTIQKYTEAVIASQQ